MDQRPGISVVVPTRDRARSLSECLTGLALQTHPPYEVVVVDDGSHDPEATAGVVRRHPGARLVRGAGHGPAAARNLGAAWARADRLAFVDDDCVPEPEWLAALDQELDRGAAVAGRTNASPAGGALAEASQLITNHLMDDTFDAATRTVVFAPSCNLACERALHQAVPFDDQFPLAAGEDRDWCRRIADTGIGIAFAPSAVVVHQPDLSFRRFWSQHQRYGRGAYRVLHRAGAPVRPQRVAFYRTLFARALTRGTRVALLVLVAQVATLCGVVRERLDGRVTDRH